MIEDIDPKDRHNYNTYLTMNERLVSESLNQRFIKSEEMKIPRQRQLCAYNIECNTATPEPRMLPIWKATRSISEDVTSRSRNMILQAENMVSQKSHTTDWNKIYKLLKS